jgi:hypothetical protein
MRLIRVDLILGARLCFTYQHHYPSQVDRLVAYAHSDLSAMIVN